ncbi:ribonuclease III domain-containing protein [Prevotellamassilia timonensis]|uniref:ribonuclease III domain-containing protein n=1 Tax=Prevotellamassilia timonensis TaxID=1852370 RepID=UPI0008D953E9|nr:ribonuclease III domain-containing protein [Prevotellamassilia timonensis]
MILNLFDRMKLPFRKNKEFLSALYDILGFYPHNIEIYRIAFSHKSLSYRRDADSKKGGKDRKANNRDRKPRSENTSKPLNNERLEYLGDAVLETIVSDILFHHFPHKREGFLTSTRSKIVQREALNRLAADMGLEKLILAAQGTRMSHTNIGGNAFEALMGAIYLDRGFKTCQWFINNRVIGQYVDLDNVAQKEVNFKSKLLEWSQKNRININFKDSACDGEKGFRTVISIEGITIARGSGRSKKESQQEASKEALTRMRREPATYDSIFRAKEKRTAMEAEESFALPKIDTIEDGLSKGKTSKAKGKNRADAPVLEEQDSKAPKSAQELSDEAYDTAYDEAASYEVIDTPPAEPVLTAEDYEAKGIPAPPEEDELKAADESLRKKRTRNRGPKTMGDAVKGQTKGATTTEERAAKREAERQAEVERQRAKAEHKRQMAEKAKAEAIETKTEPEAVPEAVASEAQTHVSGLLGALRTHADHEAEAVAESSYAKTEAPSHAEAETPVAPNAEMANDADTAHTTDEVQMLAEVEETFIIKEDIKPAQQAEDESQEAALESQETSNESQEATNESHEVALESREAANKASAEMETEVEPEVKPEAETAFDSATEKAENEAGEADKVAEESDCMAVDTDSVAEEGDDTTINTIDTTVTANYTTATAVDTTATAVDTTATAVEATEVAEPEDKDLDNDSESDAATSIVPSLTLDDIVFGTEHDEHFATLRDNNFDNADSESDTAAQADEAEAAQDKPQRNKKRTNNNRRRRRPQNANKQGTESDANGKAENATSANAPTTNADKPKPHKHRGRRRPNKGKKEGDA